MTERGINMGFLNSLGSAIGSGLKAVAGGISRGISTLGSTLSSFASGALGVVGQLFTKAASFVGLVSSLPLGPLGPVLGPIIGQLIMKVVAKGIEYLAKKLGIIKDKDEVEEVGYRIEEAQQHEDWKKQEEFGSFEEYYEYLKQQIPNNQIEYEKIKENRNRYMVLGTMELTRGIEDKMQIKMPEDFLFEIGRNRMEISEIQAIIDAFKELGYGSVMVSDFLKGKMSRDESLRVKDALITNMKKYYPNKDEDTLNERLGAMRMISRDDSRLEDIYEDKLTKDKLDKLEKLSRTDDKYFEKINFEDF